MFKRRVFVWAIMAALGAGAAFAQSGADSVEAKQKEEKQKDKEKDKEKDKSGKRAEAAVWSFALPGGDSAYLGVYLEEVTAERSRELGLSEERGALVMKVVEGSPADKAGLKENDVIVSFNGRPVDSVRELQRLLHETPAGRTASVEIIRGGGRETLRVALVKRSDSFRFEGFPEFREDLFKRNEEAFKRAEQAYKQIDELKKRQKAFKEQAFTMPRAFDFVGPGDFVFFRGSRLGVSVESLTDQLGQFFGVKDGAGVLVTEVSEDSPAARAGLKAGDVITMIEDKRVDDVGDLVSQLSAREEGPVVLTIIRDRAEQKITVTLEKRERIRAPRPPARRVISTRSFSTV